MALIPSVRGLPRAFWYVWVGSFINRAGSFVAPFLALFLTEQRGYSIGEAAPFIAIYGAGQLSAGLVGGFLADRIGRRATMVLGLVLGAASMVAFPFARGDAQIALAVFALGLLGDIYRPAVWAAVTDLVPEEDRTRAYGLFYWIINLGFAISPVLAGFIATRNFELLFFGDAVTSTLFAIVIAARVPETRPATRPGLAGKLGQKVSVREGLTPLLDPIFLGFGLSTLLVTTVFQQAFSTLPFDMRTHGISPETYGLLIAINGLQIVLLQPFILNFAQRPRPTSMLAVSALLVGVGFGIPAFAFSVPAYALSIIIWTFGEIAMSPVMPVVIAQLAPLRLRGSYNGANQMFWGAASFLAPLIGGKILGRFGSAWLWGPCIAVGVVAAAGYLLLAPHVQRRAAVVAREESLARAAEAEAEAARV